jgi:hypothetical protein
MPVTELAARISAAKRHFAGCVTPAGWDFAKTQTDFVTLLSPGAPVLARGRHGYCTCVESAFSPIGTLNGSKRWLVRARLWRLILSQNTEGWCAAAAARVRTAVTPLAHELSPLHAPDARHARRWDANSTTAFACEARAAAETQDLPATLFSSIMTALGAAAQGGDDDDIRHADGSSALDDFLDSTQQAHVRASVQGVDESLAPEEARTPRSMSLRRSASMARAEALDDCPLSCSASAITGSMPRRLSKLRADDASVEVTRVWTTLCCISVLERMTTSWLWTDGCERAPGVLCLPSVALLLTTCLPRARQRALPGAGADYPGRWVQLDREPRCGAPSACGGARGRRGGQAGGQGDHAMAPRLRAARGGAAPLRCHPHTGACLRVAVRRLRPPG